MKRILKKKTLSAANSPERDNLLVPPTQTHYEVTTIKYDKNGTKTLEKMIKCQSKPNAFKDLKNSMKMLEAI